MPDTVARTEPNLQLQSVSYVLIVVASLGLPILPVSAVVRIAVAAGLALPGWYLYRRNLAVFVPALFFIINALLNPLVGLLLSRMSLPVPQLSFLPPIAVYLGLVGSVPRLRREIRWFTRGRFNRTTVVLLVTLVAGSAVALSGWALFIADDLEQFRAFIPDVALPLLILYGLLFPVFNSFFEEFMSRAVMYDGFAALFRRPLTVVLCQAGLFALWHYNGFPGGPVGVVLVFVWSVFLGYIRHHSKGMLAPLVGHFFADLTISVILFVLVV